MIGRSEWSGVSPASGLTSSICGLPALSSRTSTRPASRHPRQRQVASATSSTPRRRSPGASSLYSTSSRQFALFRYEYTPSSAPTRSATSSVAKARAEAPVPKIPTVNSRPLRYSSTSTGWRYSSSSSVHTASKSDCDSTRDFSVTPLLDPSPAGFTNIGKVSLTAATSAGTATSVKFGVGTPQPRATCLAMPLCRVSAHTNGSENVYGTP